MKRIGLNYLVVFLVFSGIFVALFHTPLLRQQQVLFYRGLGLLAAATVLVGLGGVWCRRRWKQPGWETFLAALVMSVALNLSFFVVFPVTFDRSVTMFLLTRLSQAQPSASCAGLTTGELEQLLIKQYVKSQGAVNRRVKEQTLIGMVKTNGHCVQSTVRTAAFLRFADLVSRIYALR
ncbi:hypothetical protein M1523_01800 [Patescibacteria group bacterium]|nr:hypothetical protein [Patescibacteria group bacterium]